MEIEPLLNQPLRTLSGGESVKLALAKALALAGSSSRLVMASPLSWLSRANRALFDQVLAEYRDRQVPTETLALEGEDDLSPIRDRDGTCAEPARLAFTLWFSNVQVALGSPVNAITDEQLFARIADFIGELISPCLFAGGNGEGKSLVAKSLAGAVVTRGKAKVQSVGSTGRARLLFQDVITQTLLRSFDGLVASVKASRRDRVAALYRQLCRACAANESLADSGWEGTHQRHTLLEIKTLLIAVRLAEKPPALILDEPDWGLSRPAAIALVTAVIATAHAQGTPVILISHKPWWQPLVGSILQVAKTAGARSGRPFEISLAQA
jgi:energy-coupling factor transporter ATP-binding protein EcfA2